MWTVLWGLKKDIATQRFFVIQAPMKNNRPKIKYPWEMLEE